MKKITFISAFLLALFSANGNAQTVTVIDPAGAGGFELGEAFEDNGWGIQNATYGSRKWQIGTGQPGYTGERGAFIGTNATTVGTSAGSRTVHLYRPVTIPANAVNIQLSFKYKQEVVSINAETGPNDYLYLSLLDDAPATGNTPSASQFGEKYPSVAAAYPAYTEINVPVPAEDIATGSQKYLVFTFRSTNLNDPSTVGWGALDDVELTYDIPCDVEAPTASAQSFCESATVAQLSAQGTGLVWYNVAEGGTALEATAALATGTYYVVSTEGSCESSRTTVAVTVTVTTAPTGEAMQTITTSNAADATLEDLTVSATGTVKWYASAQNAADGENALPLTTQLENDVIYYATQTIGTCESESFAVTASVVLGANNFTIQGLAYNNPVNNELLITAQQQLTNIVITNMLGQQILVKAVNSTNANIDVAALAKGTYLLTITAGNGSTTVKIVK